jgi:hypothetical protein
MWFGWYRRREGETWNNACRAATLEECSRRLTRATRGMRLRNTDYCMTAGGYPNIPPAPDRARRPAL